MSERTSGGVNSSEERDEMPTEDKRENHPGDWEGSFSVSETRPI